MESPIVENEELKKKYLLLPPRFSAFNQEATDILTPPWTKLSAGGSMNLDYYRGNLTPFKNSADLEPLKTENHGRAFVRLATEEKPLFFGSISLPFRAKMTDWKLKFVPTEQTLSLTANNIRDTTYSAGIIYKFRGRKELPSAQITFGGSATQKTMTRLTLRLEPQNRRSNASVATLEHTWKLNPKISLGAIVAPQQILVGSRWTPTENLVISNKHSSNLFHSISAVYHIVPHFSLAGEIGVDGRSFSFLPYVCAGTELRMNPRNLVIRNSFKSNGLVTLFVEGPFSFPKLPWLQKNTFVFGCYADFMNLEKSNFGVVAGINFN